MNGLGPLSARGLYRSRNGVILGVCKGLAQYFDFSLFWVRVIFLVSLLLSGIWPLLGIYLLASIVMRPEPVRPIETCDEQDFYDSYLNSRQRAARMLKRRYEDLERRIQRMEDKVTSREFDWDGKIRT